MKRSKNSYTGSRPVFTGSPSIVPGGFNLDVTNQTFKVGDIIPAGSLAIVDETARTVKILKTAKVVAIDAEDAKVVSLQVSEFFAPLFVEGEKVLKAGAISGSYASAPTINKIVRKQGLFQITLSSTISGLAVNDVIELVVSAASDEVVGSILVTHGESDHDYLITPGLDLAAGDKVMNYPLADDAQIANAISVTSYDKASGKLVLASDPTSDAVADKLVKVFSDDDDAVTTQAIAAELGKATRVTVTDTDVEKFETAVDVSADTMQYALFEKRVAPIPASQKSGEFLAGDPHIRLTSAAC